MLLDGERVYIYMCKYVLKPFRVTVDILPSLRNATGFPGGSRSEGKQKRHSCSVMDSGCCRLNQLVVI